MRSVPWGALALTSVAVVALGSTWLPRPWTSATLQPLTQGILVAWTLWRLGHLAHTWADRCRWRRAPSWQLTTGDLPLAPTPHGVPRGVRRLCQCAGAWPHAGLFLGRAFRWTAHHTQTLALALARDGALPVANDARGGSPALHAVGRRHERPLVLPWSDLTGHVLVAGTTRSGKTRCLELLVTEAIRAPGAVVVVDPKGDAEFLVRCAWEAERQGRPFALFTPAFPTLSATFNPLETATTPAEVGARVQALMPGGGEKRGAPFFTEYPLAVLERVAAAQATLGQRWTLDGLAPPTVLRPHMEALLMAYLQHLLGPPVVRPTLQGLSGAYRRRGLGDPIADALLDDLEKPRDHFQKVTANLIPAFRGVTGAPFGHLLSTLPADLTWEGIVAREQVVYFALSSLLLGEIANRIGRVILQDLTGYLGRRYAYDDVRTACPITVVVDEFSTVAYPLFVDAVNKGGGAQARFILAMQSLADPEVTMGREQAQRLLDNLNTQIWFRLADARTAETATAGLGECTVVVPEEGAGLAYGELGRLVGSVNRHLKQQASPLLRPDWLLALPRGEAVVRRTGEVWKLRVPLLTPPPSTVGARLGLTDLTPPPGHQP
jgi:conjugal transfer pilus assembly protein TraD